MFPYVDQRQECERADVQMGCRNDLPPHSFEGPLRIWHGVAPHPSCFIFVTLPPTESLAFFSPATGTRDSRVESLVQVLAGPLEVM